MLAHKRNLAQDPIDMRLLEIGQLGIQDEDLGAARHVIFKGDVRRGVTLQSPVLQDGLYLFKANVSWGLNLRTPVLQDLLLHGDSKQAANLHQLYVIP